jgi:guanylate kinase
MKNLFLIDGASGTGKSDFVQYVVDYWTKNALVEKYSTRGKRKYEDDPGYKLDLIIVSDDEFDTLKLDYTYKYSGKKYGFYRSDLICALKNNENVFIVVRNAELIINLMREFSFINVVPIYLYSDREKISNRLKKMIAEGKMTQADMVDRLKRLDIAFRDYLNQPDIYKEVIINDSSVADFHRLINIKLKKYAENPDIDENLIFLLMSFNPDNPLLEDHANAIKRTVTNYDTGLKCINLDDVKEGAFEIARAAKEHISKCRIAIVDLTENKPNVYYELGYVHGIAKNCILTAHKSTTPHFYPAGHKILFYKNTAELERMLAGELKGILEHHKIER